MPTISLLNTSTQKALTTLARAKVFLGIGSDSKDDMITLAINHATGFIEQYCRRSFLSQTYTQEKYDGTGTKVLLLKQFPVTSITSLEQNLNPDNGDANWETIDTKDYFWYADGRIEAYSFTFDRFLAYPQKYRATYVAGYKIDFTQENTPASHNLPTEIEYATVKLVSGIMNTRRAEGLSSSRIGDLGITLKAKLFDDDEVRAILDKYTGPVFE